MAKVFSHSNIIGRNNLYEEETMKKRFLLLLALVVAFGFAFSACGDSGSNEPAGEGAATAGAAAGEATTGGAAAAGGKLAGIKDAGKLYMYTNAEFQPYEYLGEGGEIVGVDVEIGKAIAEKLGVELEVVNTQFEGIVASIASGKGDVAIAGITMDDERKAQADFSVPYINSIQYLIVPEDSKLKTIEGLAGLRIGAQVGTTGEMLLSDEISGEEGVLKDSKAEVAPYNSAPLAMEDLKAGRIDAVIIDELVAQQIATQNDGYVAIPANYESGDPLREYYGVAIQKGNEDLLAIIDEVVSRLVESGKIEEWIKKYSETK
jgi:polar amino acid transport system substrate-binding protein